MFEMQIMAFFPSNVYRISSKVGAAGARGPKELRLELLSAALANTCHRAESQMQKETEGDRKDTVTKGIFQGSERNRLCLEVVGALPELIPTRCHAGGYGAAEQEHICRSDPSRLTVPLFVPQHRSPNPTPDLHPQRVSNPKLRPQTGHRLSVLQPDEF